MKMNQPLALTFVGLFSILTWAQTLTHNGHTYVRVTVAGITDARAQASAAGAYLAAVTDQAEQDFIAANYAGTGAYLGGSDEATEGTWLWDSGEPLSTVWWGGSEPNGNGNENYINVRNDGLWNDRNGNGTRAIIEYPSVTPVILSTQEIQGVTYHEISVANLAEARAAAHALGGYLVSIDSAGEQAFVTGAFGTTTPVFIGMHDDSDEGNPELDSGFAVSYTNFVASSAQSNQNDYVVITSTGEWDYTDGHGATRAIVELGAFPADEYETNKANASIDIDGVTTDGTSAAIQRGCAGQTFTLNVSTALTLPPADVAITLGSVQARGAAGTVELGHGQVLNLDTTDPSFGFFGGNTAPALTPLTPYSLPVVGGLPGGFQASVQLLVIDLTSASLISLSQAAQLDVSNAEVAATYPGPTDDDGTVGVDVQCPITFAGVPYERIHTNANGRITFGAGSDGYAANVAGAISGLPFVGYWTDLDPSSSPGGSITTVVDDTTYTATYTDIDYHGSNVDVSFSITLHNSRSSTPGVIEISGLSDIPTNPHNYVNARVILGLSQGEGTATNSGTTPFAPSSAGQAATATDMIYDYYDGLTGLGIPSFASGIETIIFTPLPSGGYSWAGF